MCWCTPGKPIADCTFCVEERRGSLQDHERTKKMAYTYELNEPWKYGPPYAIEMDPAVKFRIETALEVMHNFKECWKELEDKKILVDGNGGRCINPEWTLYFNACKTLAEFLDPNTPNSYTFPAKKEE